MPHGTGLILTIHAGRGGARESFTYTSCGLPRVTSASPERPHRADVIVARRFSEDRRGG